MLSRPNILETKTNFLTLWPKTVGVSVNFYSGVDPRHFQKLVEM
jgi:hypothetical protein